VRDAQIGDFEDEDRIAVALGAAVEGADVGRDIPYANVLVLQVDPGRLLVLPPSMQHIFDAWLRRQRVMR
jgi:hypothetical protein